MSAGFDEVEWLASFNAVGGWCYLNAQGDLATGWEIFGRSEVDQAEARRLYSEIFEHPQAYMRQRQVGGLLEFVRESVQ